MSRWEQLLPVDVAERKSKVAADGPNPGKRHDGPVVRKHSLWNGKSAEEQDARNGHQKSVEPLPADFVFNERLHNEYRE